PRRLIKSSWRDCRLGSKRPSAPSGTCEHVSGEGKPRRSRGGLGHPFVQYPLWSQGLDRYSDGFNSPMSGTDPTGFGWFSSSSGWEGAAFFAGAVATVGGAYLSTLSSSSWGSEGAGSNFGGGLA